MCVCVCVFFTGIDGANWPTNENMSALQRDEQHHTVVHRIPIVFTTKNLGITTQGPVKTENLKTGQSEQMLIRQFNNETCVLPAAAGSPGRSESLAQN